MSNDECNNFYHKIINKDLLNLDPYSSDLSIDQKRQIIRECKNNFFYFLKHILKINNEPFKFNGYNTQIIYCLFNNINVATNYMDKTNDYSTVKSWYIWNLLFKKNTTISIIKSLKSFITKMDMDILNDIIDLPSYIKCDLLYSDNCVENCITNSYLYEELPYLSTDMCKYNSTLFWIDDCLEYVSKTIPDVQQEFKTAAEFMQNNKIYHGILITGQVDDSLYELFRVLKYKSIFDYWGYIYENDLFIINMEDD